MAAFRRTLCDTSRHVVSVSLTSYICCTSLHFLRRRRRRRSGSFETPMPGVSWSFSIPSASTCLSVLLLLMNIDPLMHYANRLGSVRPHSCNTSTGAISTSSVPALRSVFLSGFIGHFGTNH